MVRINKEVLMKKLALTLVIFLILSLCACASDDATLDDVTKDTFDFTDVIENETSTDTLDGETETAEDSCYQIPLPDEYSDPGTSCDYSKFFVKKPGGEKFDVDDDVSLINAINYLIRHADDDFDEIEIVVYFNSQGCEELLDIIDYSNKEPVYNVDYASGGKDFLLHIKYEKIDIEALKALALEDEVMSISIEMMESTLPY